MELNQLEKFERVVTLLKDNKGGQFQINHGNKYRIPKTILDMLSRPIFSLNERKVFERILLTITNSIFAITRCTSAPFVIKFKDFYKTLIETNLLNGAAVIRDLLQNWVGKNTLI